MDDIAANLRQRLLILIDQVKRDRATLTAPEHAEGAKAYTRLFDSLNITLHNLDHSAEAARPGKQT